mmetsp:Transcript_1365/g.2907  ORF Transcript_1365/g.2907 Transcript_1365/m.2907 type:complete len:246 (+) Transcript_1365:1059-1796(+)
MQRVRYNQSIPFHCYNGYIFDVVVSASHLFWCFYLSVAFCNALAGGNSPEGNIIARCPSNNGSSERISGFRALMFNSMIVPQTQARSGMIVVLFSLVCIVAASLAEFSSMGLPSNISSAITVEGLTTLSTLPRPLNILAWRFRFSALLHGGASFATNRTDFNTFEGGTENSPAVTMQRPLTCRWTTWRISMFKGSLEESSPGSLLSPPGNSEAHGTAVYDDGKKKRGLSGAQSSAYSRGANDTEE